jgi:hypothetical protein
MHPAFNYKLTNFLDSETSTRTRQMSNSSSTSSSCFFLFFRQSKLFILVVKPFETTIKQEQQTMISNGNDTSRQIRYYHDRIDFHGEILMKPPAAKSRN